MNGYPILEMKNLKQEGSLTKYFRELDVLLNKVHLLEPVSERAALSLFVG